MSVLDDPGLYSRLDPAGMRHLIAALPRQAREAWAAGQAWELPAGFRTPRRVVVVGVGGSAIGADVVASLAASVSNVPVQVQRAYAAPVTDDETLVVACSFSGETEETLAALAGARDGPGMRLAITTGGRLAEMANDLGYPQFNYRWDGPPRTAFAYGLFPLLAILKRLDAMPIADGAVERAIEGLDAAAGEWGIQAPEHSSETPNIAKQLARTLAGRIPVIIGVDFLEISARRWAADLNENAKQWAFHEALPEADHNLVSGLGAPAAARDLLHVVLLDSFAVHERNRLRARLTAQLLTEAGIAHTEVSADGGNGAQDMLEATLRACYLGDWVSLYLAMLNEVDPAPIEAIDALKASLAEHE